jgi:hypothetical protein
MIGVPDPESQRIGEAPVTSRPGEIAARPVFISWQAGRLRLFAAHPWLREVGPPAALFVISLLLRLPFISNALVNWDAVQFALATRSFDIARHQPHPPGYIL